MISHPRLELAVVHEFAHWGARIRRHLDEVQVGLLSQAQGVLHSDNTDLLTAGADEAHLMDADPVVNTGLADDSSSLLATVDRCSEEGPRRYNAGEGLACALTSAAGRGVVPLAGCRGLLLA